MGIRFGYRTEAEAFVELPGSGVDFEDAQLDGDSLVASFEKHLPEEKRADPSILVLGGDVDGGDIYVLLFPPESQPPYFSALVCYYLRLGRVEFLRVALALELLIPETPLLVNVVFEGRLLDAIGEFEVGVRCGSQDRLYCFVHSRAISG